MKANTIATAARLISARVPGPFREQGGTPGETGASRAETAARVYLGLRRYHFRPVREALERAARTVPAAAWPKGQWYGNRGTVGEPWERNGTRLRWIENTAASGFRFVAWADEILSYLRHTGYFTDPYGDGDKIRGGVWQVPGRDGRARYVPGYAEFEGRKETNPGSACLALWELETGERNEHETGTQSQAAIEAARTADRLAESVADDERDWREAYNAGREAAEAVGEAEAARKPALAAMADLRALERSAGRKAGATRDAARKALQSAREALETARDERAESWARTMARDESAWREGYAETAGREAWNGFARGLRLKRFAGETGDGLIKSPVPGHGAPHGESVQ